MVVKYLTAFQTAFVLLAGIGASDAAVRIVEGRWRPDRNLRR